MKVNLNVVEFLRDKGILPAGEYQWLARFNDGRQFDIGALILEFANLANRYPRPGESATERARAAEGWRKVWQPGHAYRALMFAPEVFMEVTVLAVSPNENRALIAAPGGSDVVLLQYIQNWQHGRPLLPAERAEIEDNPLGYAWEVDAIKPRPNSFSDLRDDIPTDPEDRPLDLGFQGKFGQAFGGDRTGLRRRGDLLGLQVFEDLDNPARPLTMVSPDGSQRVEFRDRLAIMAKKDDFWAEALRYYDAERTPAAAEDQGGPEEPPAQIL